LKQEYINATQLQSKLSGYFAVFIVLTPLLWFMRTGQISDLYLWVTVGAIAFAGVCFSPYRRREMTLETKKHYAKLLPIEYG